MVTITADDDKKKRIGRRRGARTNTPNISFGTTSVLCLALFVLVYFLTMMYFQPMLRDEEKVKRFKSAKDSLVGKVKEEGHAWKEEIERVRGPGREKVEEKLLDKAWTDFLKEKKDHKGGKPGGTRAKPGTSAGQRKDDSGNNDKPTTGFMVLGMHRSGTSMLAGLLVDGFGYKTGGPVIQPAFDNEKGFFELIPAVLQNDEFMYNQHVNWAANVGNYDTELALKETKAGHVDTVKLQKAIAVLNNPDNVPWLQKDPRMCITMRTWLPYLNSKPAVIFTYRHPLEVAMSLHKRESGITIMRGMRLWIMYNKAAVQNSADSCRVFSNNNAVLADPLAETQRIANELTKCGVPAPPKQITQNVIDGFVDPKLQHNKKLLEEKNMDKEVLATHGDCEVRGYDSLIDESDAAMRKREMKAYLTAMKVYCDLESGDAYTSDYEWPEF